MNYMEEFYLMVGSHLSWRLWLHLVALSSFQYLPEVSMTTTRLNFVGALLHLLSSLLHNCQMFYIEEGI